MVNTTQCLRKHTWYSRTRAVLRVAWGAGRAPRGIFRDEDQEHLREEFASKLRLGGASEVVKAGSEISLEG